jgi:type IV pilus assembly protein PilA
MKTKKFSKGFTLVELLLVIAIIAILATVLFVSLGQQRVRARVSAFKENMRGLVTTYTACADGAGNIQGGMGSAACSIAALNIGTVPTIPDCDGTSTATITPTVVSGDSWSATGQCNISGSAACYAICNADGCNFCNSNVVDSNCGAAATSCQ